MTLRLNTDFAAGLFGLLFAAILWFPRESMGRLSIIFPRAILVITVALSLALIVKAFTKPAAREVTIEGNPRRLLMMIAVLFAWWYAIDLLGFLLATAIVFFGLTWYLANVEGAVSGRRLVQWVPIVAVLIGVFYLAFTEVLSVRLPTGIWS
ncbi:tripartite tricarboxylate transporter TctB family protein [Chromohalobacter marismortui]|uniref:Tripartite tricarboxylate transporter TctB family protein n=1 Tax=Chromohalobacter marismortui TaxID=42055 RepID=A0A4R7NRZ8_9GAMM|nr:MULTISPECIES: tripartite tricarboxylate transporter TctB family protein [Chromohalobacter]MCI0509322.1 tripartite tricarboxylate transporter TctB family protein [Chromohalobacter sp.]MCI0592327.1 tripartite tricarboxylate transporter TctB family protein [Chromohalobacter sp.]TDU23785.1 tripartite tricarboxylate transporter TctB family protein [Chromohalobacter marismortui]